MEMTATEIEKNAKEDALMLAQLLYDIFNDNGSSDKVEDGQNQANLPGEN